MDFVECLGQFFLEILQFSGRYSFVDMRRIANSGVLIGTDRFAFLVEQGLAQGIVEPRGALRTRGGARCSRDACAHASSNRADAAGRLASAAAGAEIIHIAVGVAGVGGHRRRAVGMEAFATGIDCARSGDGGSIEQRNCRAVGR